MAVVVDKEWLEAGLTDVSDSIRGLIESEEKLEFPQGMKEAVESYSLDEPLEAQDALIEQIKTALQGKASGGDNPFLYATYENGGTFRSAIFPENYDIYIKINDTESLKTQGINFNQLFMGSKNLNTITIELPEELPVYVYMQNMFNGTDVKEINFIKENGDVILKPSNTLNCFNGCVRLEIINAIFDLSIATSINTAFNKCNTLKEIRFVNDSIKATLNIGYSSLLSNASIQSIIDGLADLTGTTSQTLTLHADVKAKLTETQISTITSKNWTLA